MKFETIKGRSLYSMLAIPVGAPALTGCGANYSGDGNEFVVHGRVTDPGSHSLRAKIYHIESARGEADDWFELNHEHQLHDNCNCHGFWNSNKKFGTVYDLQGYEVEPSQVAIGACVRFYGRIRANSEGKTSSTRPVYETVNIERCET
jgi:hypothetical protein